MFSLMSFVCDGEKVSEEKHSSAKRMLASCADRCIHTCFINRRRKLVEDRFEWPSPALPQPVLHIYDIMNHTIAWVGMEVYCLLVLDLVDHLSVYGLHFFLQLLLVYCCVMHPKESDRWLLLTCQKNVSARETFWTLHVCCALTIFGTQIVLVDLSLIHN